MPKSDRLLQIVELLHDHPEGLSKSEIAKRMGVHRSTIGRDIASMESSYALVEDDDGLISIDRKSFLSELHLSMFELEALHLSAKLFQKVMNFPFPHAAAAMRKLADAQGKVSISLAQRMRETAELIDKASPVLIEDFPAYRHTIEQLGVAISEYRPVTITHFSKRRNDVSEYDILPVTLEPHPEGKAVHLIGWRYTESQPSFITLKTERIRSIHLYKSDKSLFDSIPFAEYQNRLSAAWSIWSTEAEPVEVKLRFSPRIAERVKETKWHMSQVIKTDENGFLLWEGRIAAPQEMYPWIRGWGPDVEVLEPEWLREMHRKDFAAGLNLYD